MCTYSGEFVPFHNYYMNYVDFRPRHDPETFRKEFQRYVILMMTEVECVESVSITPSLLLKISFMDAYARCVFRATHRSGCASIARDYTDIALSSTPEVHYLQHWGLVGKIEM